MPEKPTLLRESFESKETSLLIFFSHFSSSFIVCKERISRKKMASLLFNLFAVLMISIVKIHHANEIFYVCEAHDSKFIGAYVAGRQNLDGVAVFSNQNDMSFFRSKGFWYLGNLAPWPPETHYRCVEAEGCNYNLPVPPTSEEGAWKGSKKYNDGGAPRVSATPCASATSEEL
jgi:hypothetical protein